VQTKLACCTEHAPSQPGLDPCIMTHTCQDDGQFPFKIKLSCGRGLTTEHLANKESQLHAILDRPCAQGQGKARSTIQPDAEKLWSLIQVYDCSPAQTPIIRHHVEVHRTHGMCAQSICD